MKKMLLVVLALGLSGCAAEKSEPAGVISTDSIRPLQEAQEAKNKYLAYSHTLTATVEKANLATVFESILTSCSEDKDHQCLVMHAEQSEGTHAYGKIRLRVVPEGIAKFKTLISRSGKVENQTSSAVDLTDSVVDSEKRLEMLENYQAKLQRLEQDPTINIDSLIKVASELSKVQAQIEYSQGEKAELFKRINTDSLTINLQTPYAESWRNPISESFSNLGDDFVEGVAIFITAIAYLLPWMVLLLLLIWLWRTLRARNKSEQT